MGFRLSRTSRGHSRGHESHQTTHRRPKIGFPRSSPSPFSPFLLFLLPPLPFPPPLFSFFRLSRTSSAGSRTRKFFTFYSRDREKVRESLDPATAARSQGYKSATIVGAGESPSHVRMCPAESFYSSSPSRRGCRRQICASILGRARKNGVSSFHRPPGRCESDRRWPQKRKSCFRQFSRVSEIPCRVRPMARKDGRPHGRAGER